VRCSPLKCSRMDHAVFTPLQTHRTYLHLISVLQTAPPLTIVIAAIWLQPYAHHNIITSEYLTWSVFFCFTVYKVFCLHFSSAWQLSILYHMTCWHCCMQVMYNATDPVINGNNVIIKFGDDRSASFTDNRSRSVNLSVCVSSIYKAFSCSTMGDLKK